MVVEIFHFVDMAVANIGSYAAPKAAVVIVRSFVCYSARGLGSGSVTFIVSST